MSQTAQTAVARRRWLDGSAIPGSNAKDRHQTPAHLIIPDNGHQAAMPAGVTRTDRHTGNRLGLSRYARRASVIMAIREYLIAEFNTGDPPTDQPFDPGRTSKSDNELARFLAGGIARVALRLLLFGFTPIGESKN
jgi:hypothetical protein